MRKTLFLIIVVLILSFTLNACRSNGKECEHQYDYDCDTICNICSEERNVDKHNFTPATCDAPKTCKDCGLTEGEKLAHVPDQDDGDCTTKIQCSLCDEVLIGSLEHVYDEEYKYDNLEIIIKKQFCGIQDVFHITRNLNISTSTLTDILYELIQLNENDIDECINESLGDSNG